MGTLGYRSKQRKKWKRLSKKGKRKEQRMLSASMNDRSVPPTTFGLYHWRQRNFPSLRRQRRSRENWVTIPRRYPLECRSIWKRAETRSRPRNFLVASIASENYPGSFFAYRSTRFTLDNRNTFQPSHFLSTTFYVTFIVLWLRFFLCHYSASVSKSNLSCQNFVNFSTSLSKYIIDV